MRTPETVYQTDGSDPADGFLWGHDIAPTAASIIFSPKGRELLLSKQELQQEASIRLRHLVAVTYEDLAGLGMEPEIPSVTQFLGKYGLFLAESPIMPAADSFISVNGSLRPVLDTPLPLAS